MASFGEELKRERELRDISLKEISEATKISIRFLEALEQNNFDILPGGIFNRGFIRAYARFIGVDGEEMVNSYLHELSVREAGRQRDGRGEQRSGPAGSTQLTPSPGLLRGEPRSEDRAEARHATPRESRSSIRLEPRFTTKTSPERFGGRAPTTLWVAVLLAFLIGAGLFAFSMLGNRMADASAQSRASTPDLTEARLSQKIPEIPAEASTGQQDSTDPNAAGSIVQDSKPGEETSPPATGLDGASAMAVEPTPVVPDHRLTVRATEVTRVRVECGGLLSLDEELWPGQSRTLNCVEPVLMGAANGGAVLYSLDGGAAGLLGGVGEQVEGLIIAPSPVPDPNDMKGAPSGETTHAGA